MMEAVSEPAAATPSWQARVIRMGSTEYPYYYGFDCLDLIVESLAGLGADLFIVVTDDRVLELHGEALLSRLGELARVEVVSQPPGETGKTVPILAGAIERILAMGATRRSVVVGFGGGVPGNLAGLLASLVFRGIRLVHIPTSTVAAMDSVLSLKQAVNSRVGKNHIGTYLAPLAVYTDVKLLMTLSDRELRSGLCEAAKNCFAIEPKQFSTLRTLLAARRPFRSAQSLMWLLDVSIEAKSRVMLEDPREQRTGLVLEYGHTVGHAVELADFRHRGADGLSHGAAIAFGMVVAAHLSHRLGWLSSELVALHEEVVSELRAPTRLPAWLSVDEVMEIVRKDNKRGYLPTSTSSAPFVLLRGLGSVAGKPELPLVPVPLDEVRSVLTDLSDAAAVPSQVRVSA